MTFGNKGKGRGQRVGSTRRARVRRHVGPPPYKGTKFHGLRVRALRVTDYWIFWHPNHLVSGLPETNHAHRYTKHAHAHTHTHIPIPLPTHLLQSPSSPPLLNFCCLKLYPLLTRISFTSLLLCLKKCVRERRTQTTNSSIRQWGERFWWGTYNICDFWC